MKIEVKISPEGRGYVLTVNDLQYGGVHMSYRSVESKAEAVVGVIADLIDQGLDAEIEYRNPVKLSKDRHATRVIP